MFAAAILVVLVAVPVFGQGRSWKDEMVLATKPPKDIKFGETVNGKQVAYAFSGRWPLKVRDDKDGRLRLHDGRHEGWVDKKDFVLASESFAYFDGRIRANARDAWALAMRGAYWLDKKEPDKAIPDFDTCIALNPSDAVAYNNRGYACYLKKEYERAVADYSEALRLSPKYTLAYNNRGLTYRVMGEYDRAVADFSEAIHLEPSYAGAFNNRGTIALLRKDYDRALRDFDVALRLDPKFALAYDYRGLCYRHTKQYDRAIADGREALRHDAKLAAAYSHLAWVYATCPEAPYRDGKKAVELATKGCELTKWKDANIIDTLAAAYAESSDFEQAVRYERQALESPKLEKKAADGFRKRLESYEKKQPYRE
jgi:tetratricopeptide (TPR) repeat protein